MRNAISGNAETELETCNKIKTDIINKNVSHYTFRHIEWEILSVANKHIADVAHFSMCLTAFF